MEIKHLFLKKRQDPEDELQFIQTNSKIQSIEYNTALAAADIKQNHGLYTINVLIYAVAQQHKSQLLTADHHFEKLPNVIILE